MLSGWVLQNVDPRGLEEQAAGSTDDREGLGRARLAEAIPVRSIPEAPEGTLYATWLHPQDLAQLGGQHQFASSEAQAAEWAGKLPDYATIVRVDPGNPTAADVRLVARLAQKAYEAQRLAEAVRTDATIVGVFGHGHAEEPTSGWRGRTSEDRGLWARAGMYGGHVVGVGLVDVDPVGAHDHPIVPCAPPVHTHATRHSLPCRGSAFQFADGRRQSPYCPRRVDVPGIVGA